MGRFRIGVHPLRICMVIALSVMIFATVGLAEQIKFGDWVCIKEPDPATSRDSKRIGTYARDGISTLWLAESDAGEDRIQLTLKSQKKIASVYFSYRIDRVDTLTIRSAIKGCEFNCLTDFVPRNGELIKTMKRGLRIKFEYDSYPDIAQKPTFSLRGFSKAYQWLLSK